jgi:hypothetical protein
MPQRRSVRTARKPRDARVRRGADEEVAEEPEDEFAEEPGDELAEEPGDEFAEEPGDEFAEEPEDEDDVEDDVEEEPEDEASEDEPEDEGRSGRADGADGRADGRRSRRRGSGLTAAQAARAALQQIAELTGKQPEGITGVERADDGWLVGVEVVEDRRIPSSTDILATYRTEIGTDGDLMSYRRIRRYPRGQGDDGDS